MGEPYADTGRGQRRHRLAPVTRFAAGTDGLQWWAWMPTHELTVRSGAKTGIFTAIQRFGSNLDQSR